MSHSRTKPFMVIDHEYWLCPDCMIVAVNDDPSGIDNEEDVAATYAGLARLGNISPAFDSETGEGHEEFSSRGCDCCQSGLAGEFYMFVSLKDTPADYEQCGDCGYDHAYEYSEAHAWHDAHPCSYCNYDVDNDEHEESCPTQNAS